MANYRHFEKKQLFDNSGTNQAIKMHNMSNSTIFVMTNPMKLLFFKFEII